MTNNEYKALARAINELRVVDANFSTSCFRNLENQFDLYRELALKLDDLYEVAFMLMDNENYKRDRRRRSCCVGR